MILSRISKAIREQNWLAVAIEFVIVILGVVIGFQVTSWADRQAEAARVELYLDRLITDLEENEQRFANALTFRSNVREMGLEALAYANGSRVPADSWRVVLTYFNASQAGGAEVVDATYREMVATGDLRLLRDLDLRGRLSAYYSSSGNGYITEELPAYREDVRAIIPISIQTYIWEHCHEALDARGQRLLNCDAPETDADALSALATRLMQDDALNGRLRYWVSSQYAAVGIHTTQTNLTREMLQGLRQARNASGGEE